MVSQMVSVGEDTGRLQQVLERLTDFYTREVNDAIEKLQSLIQPVLTLVLGGMIAWIMSSVLLPIYDLISKVKF